MLTLPGPELLTALFGGLVALIGAATAAYVQVRKTGRHTVAALAGARAEIRKLRAQVAELQGALQALTAERDAGGPDR